MPNRDGKGPKGNGPITGCGSGKCIVTINTKDQEIDYLENRKQALQDQLSRVNKRLKILKK